MPYVILCLQGVVQTVRHAPMPTRARRAKWDTISPHPRAARVRYLYTALNCVFIDL